MIQNRFYNAGFSFKKVREVFGRPHAFAYSLARVRKNTPVAFYPINKK